MPKDTDGDGVPDEKHSDKSANSDYEQRCNVLMAEVAQKNFCIEDMKNELSKVDKALELANQKTTDERVEQLEQEKHELLI